MAASAMYKIKPIYGNSDVVEELPTCMYKMKNIHRVSSEDMVDNPEVLEIINCQKAILDELESLKLEVDQISADIGINSQSKPAKVQSAKEPPATPRSSNIVVKASPDDPPLSVYLLYQLAHKHGLECSIMSHVHSSWSGQVPNEVNKLFNNSCHKNSNICFQFIWKSVILAPNLMISVADQSPILGESNILRYLARQFLPDLYNSHNPLQITIIDEWLCSAMKLTSPKDSKNFIHNLNVHLGKNNWLSGNAFSIADIYCSVALLKNNFGGQLPKSVSTWIAECRREFPGFDQIEKLCK